MRHSIMILALITGLTLALATGTTARAAGQDAPAGQEDMFTTMDANKDGVLTKEEFAAHGMAEDFAKYDANGDGKVTQEEFKAAEGTAKMPGM